MIPPTSIDGTDITGATIDGTDVQEITVDGDVVFSAQQLPVAYSNLVVWYPFDSAEYGGSNADDVTAIIGGSGDDTAYDGTVNGATYQSSGGVTDINAGLNSGGFDFDGSNDFIEFTAPSTLKGTGQRTITCWFNTDTSSETVLHTSAQENNVGQGNVLTFSTESGGFRLRVFSGKGIILQNSYNNNENVFVSFSILDSDLSNSKVRVRSENASSFSQDNFTGFPSIDTITTDYLLGGAIFGRSDFNGTVDDFRVYNTFLSNSQIDQIYQNTQP